MRKINLLDSDNAWAQRNAVLSSCVVEHFEHRTTPISILEAGCGQAWHLDLKDVPFQLTGVDISSAAMESRQSKEQDLSKAIVGDLRTVQFGSEEFDVVYCCDVLEHISGAEQVVDRFFEWIKPSGLLVLVFPDRDSVWGFMTRSTPNWVHIAYYKYVKQRPWAGTPGYGPFPTVFDRIVSRRGIHEYCRANRHNIVREYGRPAPGVCKNSWISATCNALFKLFQILSFGKLSAYHGGLVLVIEK